MTRARWMAALVVALAMEFHLTMTPEDAKAGEPIVEGWLYIGEAPARAS